MKIPHDIELEQAVLGSLLVDNRLYERCDTLRPDHFFDPLHGQIFESIATLINADRSATAITLKQFFENAAPVSEGLTVPQYLGRLVPAAVDPRSFKDYVKDLRDYAQRRALIGLAQDVIESSEAGSIPVEAVMAQVESNLTALSEKTRFGEGFLGFNEALRSAIQMAGNAYERNGGLSGISSGLHDLDRQMGGLQRSDLIVLAGRPSMGKCLPNDAPVLMADGAWKPNGDLQIGDRVASHDGLPSTVTGIFPQGTRQMYRITFKDGRSTECCAEHLWRVMNRKWKTPRTLDTAQLISLISKPSFHHRLWINSVSGDFGADVELPIDAYILGSLISNGGLSCSSVRLTTPHQSVLDRIETASSGVGVALRHQMKFDWRLCGNRRVGGNPIINGLRELGLFGHKAETKFIPPSYLSASKATRTSLLQGLMDGDGWVETFGAMRYGTSSYRLALDVQHLVRSLGGLATVSPRAPKYVYKGKKLSGLPSWVVNMSFADGTPFVSVPEKLSRVSVESGRQPRLTISSIEPSRMADAQCISVSHQDHLYVTNDYIVTHNTALATNIAYHVASNRFKSLRAHPDLDPHDPQHDGGVVAFFSLEMSAEQLATRILSEQAEIMSEKIRRGTITEQEFERLVDVSQRLKEIPLYIDQTGGITIHQLAARARKLKRQKGLDVMVVDYLQLLSGPQGASNSNRVQVVTDITTGLKALAKELNVPIIALSQLSRQVETREDKRPQLSDLRESGSIEQDADVVMFVFREEYYVERTKPNEGTIQFGDWMTKMASVVGKADVIIGKQRHGPVGSVQLSFDSRYTRFSDLAREQYIPERTGSYSTGRNYYEPSSYDGSVA